MYMKEHFWGQEYVKYFTTSGVQAELERHNSDPSLYRNMLDFLILLFLDSKLSFQCNTEEQI